MDDCFEPAGLAGCLLAVLIVRALLYKPKAERERFSEPVFVDREKVVRDMHAAASLPHGFL